MQNKELFPELKRIGIKCVNEDDDGKLIRIVFDSGIPFEVVQGNIFLIQDERYIDYIRNMLEKENVEYKEIKVRPISDLPKEKQAEIREKMYGK